MKKIFISMLIITVIGLVGCSIDIKTSKYKDYDSAKIDIEKGWIPRDLPSSAIDIYEIHNIDTNECNGIFTIPKEEIKGFYDELNAIDKEEILSRKFIESKLFVEDDIKKGIRENKFLIGSKSNVIYVIDEEGKIYYFIDNK